ncbi:glycoside hydrolase/deacetylase [Dendrothele bispora CBS 962.96]|uniref:chitin deacetylase n=1 Tax=Dendrothele bispora (strain CBS 962.96) TaxID=1314807 RepID=A0A4V4HIZ5_DENBC|nr:glycoside hydrolase/deacetylase [Dendrothele bispora CBS 962.96]
MLFSTLLLPLFLSLLSVADAHSHRLNKRLPSPSWHHARDHPVHALFRRDPGDDGQDYPDVGTPEWSSKYPNGPPDVTKMPAGWSNALKAAVSAGKIPNIPVSSSPGNVNPTYPAGHDPNGPEICSSTYKCRGQGEIWDGPDGTFGLGFDDGPLPPSGRLYDFLREHNETPTDFMIGLYILQNSQMFLQAVDDEHDIAVHTWTHPYMTTQTNEQVVAQLGWTMQIIHDSTGGRIPKYWRPPYGDSDNRVRAIAKEIFGLECIIWNQDTEDWSLTTNGTTPQAINASMTHWLTGPKSPGLIILEHELSDQSVQAFIDAYPVIVQNGWKIESVAQLANATNPSAYRNAPGTGDGPVTAGDILAPTPQTTTSATSSSSAT